jgi:hypothetical protein
MYYFTVLSRMEHEQRVKAFEAHQRGERKDYDGLRRMFNRAEGLFSTLKYRLNAPRMPAKPADNPWLEIQPPGNSGC